MTNVDLSIVIPTYRREEAVVKAVRSILPLLGLRWEIIVADDNHEPTARHGLEQLGDPRIHYIHRQSHSGGNPGIVRNEAVYQSAKGRYLYFLDDDDTAVPATLRKMVGSLERTGKGVAIAAVAPFGPPGSGVVASEIKHFSGARRFLTSVKSPLVLLTSMLFGMPVVTCSACIIRRTIFEDIGGFDPDIPIHEDLDLYVRAIRRSGFNYIDDIVLNRRTGLPSLINDETNSQQIGPLCYRRIYSSYKRTNGYAEFLAMRIMATVLRRGRRSWPVIDTNALAMG